MTNKSTPLPESLLDEIDNFKEGNIPFSATEFAENEKILKLRSQDYQWRIEAREHYGYLIFQMLFCQNIAVFGLVYLAFFTHELKDLQLILGTVITGTLTATYFSINYLIKWLFTDINYNIRKVK